MPKLMLICQDVASCPEPAVPSLRGKCSRCRRPVWVSFGGLALEAGSLCLRCGGASIVTGETTVPLRFTRGLGPDMAGLRRQVTRWLREYRGLNLAGIIQGRRVGSEYLEIVGAHCGRTGDYIGAQIVLSLGAFTEPERAAIVQDART